MDVLRQVIESSPRGLKSAVVTQDLKVVCEKCLEKDPADRYESAADLADDLRRFVSGEAIAARPIGRLGSAVRWMKRNPTMATLGVLAGFLLLFGLINLVLLLRTENAARIAAEAGADRERELNSEIQQALNSEQAARQRAEFTLNDAYANYADSAQRQNRPYEAFLWLCNASREFPDNRTEVNRRRVAAWMKRIPRPVFAYHEKRITRAEFDSSNRWLLCSRKNKYRVRVFDLHTGAKMPFEFEGSSTCVTWGKSPGILWIGTDDGHVLRLDCQTRAVAKVTRVAARVTSPG